MFKNDNVKSYLYIRCRSCMQITCVLYLPLRPSIPGNPSVPGSPGEPGKPYKITFATVHNFYYYYFLIPQVV